MSQLSSIPLIYLDSGAPSVPDDSTTPRIVRNIERISDRYRKYIESEIAEEITSQTEQAEQVKKLRNDKRKTIRSPKKTEPKD